jgi:hypothetical protein
MPQETKQIKTVQIDFKCPECEDGYLRPTGQCFTTHPPQYPHICNSMICNYSETFINKTYPYVDYVSEDSKEAEA